MTDKPCHKCGSLKRYKSGKCIPCAQGRSLKWAAENRERSRANARRWASANKEARRRHAADFRQKQRMGG